MKRHYKLIALGLMTSLFGAQSCLDFDVSGDEFNSTTENVDKVTTRGDVDKIDFKMVGTNTDVLTPQNVSFLGILAEQLQAIILTPEQEGAFGAEELVPSEDGKPGQLKITLEAAKQSGLTGEQAAVLALTAEQLKEIRLTEEQMKENGKKTGEMASQTINKLRSKLANAQAGEYWMRGGKNAEPPVAHAYQYQFTTGTDILSQYGVVPHTFYTYAKVNVTSAYDISTTFYGGAMGHFKGMANAYVPLLNSPEVDSIPEIKAIFLLLLDYAAIEVTDIYGPMPYTDIKTNKQDSPYTYESVEDIYSKVEENVDSIISCFEYFDGQHMNANGEMVDNKTAEYKAALFNALILYEQLTMQALNFKYTNMDTWKRFANSLKLRMAMHVVKRDPAYAKKRAEEAVKSGVVETKEHEVALRPAISGFSQPVLQIYQWGDQRMTASMESLLKSLNHPYIGNLFIPIKNDLKNEKTGEVTEAGSGVYGMRSGAHPGMNQGYDGNQYIAFSELNQETFSQAPLYLMKMSEVAFLRAEGAVRGWEMGGSPEEFYNKGIMTASFEDRDMPSTSMGENYDKNFYDVLIDDYMNKESATPFTYHDPTGQTPDIESLTKIGVKWNEADSRETKLEKIITQKYIAGFPYSFEAYVDLRRTGYPKLFPVLNADECSFGTIQQGDMIRRLPFPDSQDAATMQDIKATGLEALGGPDECSTRLWWDEDKPNF